jgi:YaiO family outer membrane protein
VAAVKLASLTGTALLLLLSATTTVCAADFTEISLTQTALGFSSDNNAYGPWHLNSLAVLHGTFEATYGAEIDYGSVHDGQLSGQGTFAGVNYTRNWSDEFYSFVAVGAGTANPYPTLSAYAEANFKMLRSRRLVLSVGFGTNHYGSGFGETFVSVGGEYYWPQFVAGVRAVITTNTSSPTVVGALVTLQYDPARSMSIVATLQLGPQNYLSSAPLIPPSRANYQGYSATLIVKQHLTNAVGIQLGGVLEQQSDAVTRRPVFTARGITFGVFVLQ